MWFKLKVGQFCETIDFIHNLCWMHRFLGIFSLEQRDTYIYILSDDTTHSAMRFIRFHSCDLICEYMLNIVIDDETEHNNNNQISPKNFHWNILGCFTQIQKQTENNKILIYKSINISQDCLKFSNARQCQT